MPPLDRGGLVFKAHRLLYHSTLGLRVIKRKEKKILTFGGAAPAWLLLECVLLLLKRTRGSEASRVTEAGPRLFDTKHFIIPQRYIRACIHDIRTFISLSLTLSPRGRHERRGRAFCSDPLTPSLTVRLWVPSLTLSLCGRDQRRRGGGPLPGRERERERVTRP